MPPGVMDPQLFNPPQPRSSPAAEMILAPLLPLVTCGSGSWIFFVVLATRRRDHRQLVVAAFYLMAFLVACFVTFVVDPTPLDSDDFSTAEDIGFAFLFSLPLVAAIHGSLVAFRLSHADRDRAVRDRIRAFAHYAPDQARTLGIGRPDLIRAFDDGGLIDLNHLGAPELAWATGLPADQAHRIVTNRLERGPFQRPEDLLIRGLATKRTMRRLAPRLICIPPH
jgi:hypothetical protein